jgi:hypothetical protein
MSEFERPGTTIEEPTKRKSAAARFGDLSDRLSRTFGGLDRTRAELPAWDADEGLDYPLMSDTVAWSPTQQRFPVVRNGYDCAAVDQQFDEVERELAELKEQRSSSGAVAAELDRIGSQTAAVLQAAYEQAAEITRDAREQADRCLADAAANAVGITEKANRRLRELDVETDSVWQERSRLIDDARGVATALLSLADDAAARFPTESDKLEQVDPPAPQPPVPAEQPGPGTPEQPGPRTPELES